VLSAKNLNKKFGSLVVAQDIALELPKGARFALIGPNGAGKTTLMNLMTGMLAPDAGQIFLDGEEITALQPHQRVRRGLARTFQINTLFPRLSALEAVTLAVLEREGHAHNWWRGLPSFGAAIDEAQAILASLKVPPTRQTKELAYGQQRLLEIALALATRPKVLLLDEPAAGVPKDESAQLFNAIDPSPFHERDLDPNAEAFIVGWARDLHRRAPLALLVHLQRSPGIRAEEEQLREAVGESFRRRAASARGRLRELLRIGRLLRAVLDLHPRIGRQTRQVRPPAQSGRTEHRQQARRQHEASHGKQ